MRPLQPLLTQALDDGKPIVLDPGGDYALADQFVVPAGKAIQIQGNGARLTCSTAHSNFMIYGNLRIDGLRILQAGTFAQVQQGGSTGFVRVTSPDDTMGEFIISYSDSQVECDACDIGITARVSFYGTGLQLYDCIGRGSRHEYVVRSSSDDGKPHPVLISGGEFFDVQRGNIGAKDVIGIRSGVGSIVNAKIHGHTRFGQNPPGRVPTPGEFCTMAISGCTFLDNSPGQPYISALGGSILTIDSTTFLQPTQQPIAQARGSKVILDGVANEKQPAATPWQAPLSPGSASVAAIGAVMGVTGSGPPPLAGKNSATMTPVEPALILARLPADKPWAPLAPSSQGEIVPLTAPSLTRTSAGPNFWWQAGTGTVVAKEIVATAPQMVTARQVRPPINWPKILAGGAVLALAVLILARV